MDVRLPDGTIIRNVPDGTTRAELTAKLKANGYTLDEPKPAPSEDGGGMLETAGRVARLLTPAGLVSNAFTKQGRKDLLNTVAGGIRGAGSIGATAVAPVDMAMDAIDGKGLSLDSNRQRRKDMDEVLQGFGADTQSMPFQVGRLGAEVGGTLGVSGAVANGLTRVAPPAANALIQAIRSGGMTTGVRPGASIASKAADLGVRSAGGAISGGLTAGAINPDDAALGTALGAAAPPAVKLLGSAGRAIGSAVSNRAARSTATNKLAEVLGDDAGQAIADIQTYYPKGAENIPVSSAAVTANPKLAAMEQGSRLRASPAWYDFDQRQGKAVFDNVLRATDEAGELGARKGLRAENWREAWQAASEAQKPRVWLRRMNGFFDNVDQAMLTPESSNPAVKGVLEAIKGEMDRLGPSFGPGNLQQIRANLNGKANSMSPDVFKSAPRDNPAIISVIKEIDDILNASTGGKWQKVIEGYAKDSEGVRAAAAAGKVRGSFVDADTGRVLKTALDPKGDVARVTESGLTGAMNAARMPDKSLALSSDATARLEATLGALRRQNMVQSLKRSATAGGGSDTISNELAAGAAQAAGAPNMLLQLMGAVRKLGTGRVDNELAQLLSNPDDLALVLRALQQPRPSSSAGALMYRGAPALAADR